MITPAVRREALRRQPMQWPANKPKPRLKAQGIPIYRVHYRDLETYLYQVYRMKDFDFMRATCGVPGVCPEYQITAELPAGTDRNFRAYNIRCGQRTKDIGLILNVLCIDGFIPAGLYIIDTSVPPDPYQQYMALLKETRDPQHPKCIAFKRSIRKTPHEKPIAELDRQVHQWLKKQQPQPQEEPGEEPGEENQKAES